MEEGISQYAARPEPWIQVPQYSRKDGKAARESALSEKSKLKRVAGRQDKHTISSQTGDRGRKKKLRSLSLPLRSGFGGGRRRR